MNIFFDHQTFSLQSYGGISRYYAELISGINQSKSDEAYLSVMFSNNIYLHEKNIIKKPFFPNNIFPKKLEILYRLNQMYSTFDMNIKSFDIFHATYYNTYFAPYLKKKPLVVTFLDMIHEKYSNQFHELAADKYITEQKRKIANDADVIITISESTKRDVIESFNINPNKIKVIYLGNSLRKHGNTIKENKLLEEKPYLLFVGRRGHYKNFKRLVEAIHSLLKKHDLRLLCGGGEPFSEEEILHIKKLNVERLVEYVPVNDHTLQLLYQNATAFIFPSLYEGFGIPVLEAFACDCPCIVSNSSSLPEVAGNAALYIDPLSNESIISAVEKLLFNNMLRQELVLKGKEQLSQFSWEKTVNKTLDLYRSIS